MKHIVTQDQVRVDRKAIMDHNPVEIEKPIWDGWNKRSLLIQVKKSIERGWGIDPDLLKRIPDILVGLINAKDDKVSPAVKVRVVEALKALEQQDLERAKLALEALKFKHAVEVTMPPEPGDDIIEDVLVLRMRRRMSKLQSGELGRPLAPGLKPFVVDAPVEVRE